MLTAKAKQRANQQIRALIEIGTPKPEAIYMIARGAARRIRKSIPGEVDDRPLPTVDTTAADRRREELEAELEAEQSKPASVEPKQKQKIGGKRILLRLKPKKPGDKRPFSPNTRIVEKLNGEQWLYQAAANGKLTVRQLGKYKTPVFVETVAGNSEKGDDKVKKSQRFERLVEMARTAPEKLSAGTRAALNNYLNRSGMEPVVTPAPKITFGRQMTLHDVAQLRAHQADTAPASALTTGPGLKQSRMTPQEIQAHRLQQAIDAQKESAKPKPPEKGITVNWLNR